MQIKVGAVAMLGVVANAFGLSEIDIEPFPGRVKITFKKDGVVGSVTGETEAEACQKIFCRLGLT